MHALGFKGPYTGKGPHPLMWKGAIRVMIPNPHRTDVSFDLIKKILRQGEISREEWLYA
jgi:predicted RNA binding protein YcfA (HicA-like mRNA interferase family)